MKKVFVFIFALMLSVGVMAGRGGIGIKAGLNFSFLPENLEQTFGTGSSLIAYADTYSGYHLGITSLFVMPGFFLQPELLYVRSGRDMAYYEGNSPIFFIEDYHHLTLPVQLGIKIGPLKVGAGPIFSILLDHSSDLTNPSLLTHKLNTLAMGYQAGAGLKIGSLMFDARYEGSLSNIGSGITVGGQDIPFDMRPRQYVFSVGLLF